MSKIQQITLELFVYSILFWGTLFLPICNFYYLGQDEETITKPQYISTFQIAFFFIAYFGMPIIAFYSLNKKIIVWTSAFVVTLVLLTFLLIQWTFAWWGASPYHPELSSGYWLSHLMITILLVRIVSWIDHLGEITVNDELKMVFSMLAKLIPILFIVFIVLIISMLVMR